MVSGGGFQGSDYGAETAHQLGSNNSYRVFIPSSIFNKQDVELFE